MNARGEGAECWRIQRETLTADIGLGTSSGGRARKKNRYLRKAQSSPTPGRDNLKGGRGKEREKVVKAEASSKKNAITEHKKKQRKGREGKVTKKIKDHIQHKIVWKQGGESDAVSSLRGKG